MIEKITGHVSIHPIVQAIIMVIAPFVDMAHQVRRDIKKLHEDLKKLSENLGVVPEPPAPWTERLRNFFTSLRRDRDRMWLAPEALGEPAQWKALGWMVAVFGAIFAAAVFAFGR